MIIPVYPSCLAFRPLFFNEKFFDQFEIYLFLTKMLEEVIIYCSSPESIVSYIYVTVFITNAF